MSSSRRRHEGGATWPAGLVPYLRRGVRSAQDVRAYLTRRGVAAGELDPILRECRRRGWIDDRACARLWADTWARRGYAWAAIRLRLTGRGLDARAIDDAAARLGMDAAAEESRARQLAHARRRPGMTPRRLSRWLAGRGFDQELIERVVPDVHPSHADES